MCSLKQPKPPKVVERDPVAEAAEAANVSQGKANAQLAQRRKKLRANSLYTTGGAGIPAASAYASAAYASPTLGGG